MASTPVTCSCGRTLSEHMDFVNPSYVITYVDVETQKFVTECRGCGKPLYPSLINGELKRAA